jgi:hypothetical protein
MKWIWGLPWDVKLGYAAFFEFLTWLAWGLCSGPSLLFFMGAWLTFLLLVAALLIVLCQCVFSCPRLHRALVAALLAGALAFLNLVGPHGVVDLHLVASIYAAGGPKAVNTWAQGLIAAQQQGSDSRELDRDEIPSGVRTWLPGWTSVGGTLWSEEARVRIEIGGGFYHYGVVVYQTGSGPASEWWQQVLGWPPEVKVYHED